MTSINNDNLTNSVATTETQNTADAIQTDKSDVNGIPNSKLGELDMSGMVEHVLTTLQSMFNTQTSGEQAASEQAGCATISNANTAQGSYHAGGSERTPVSTGHHRGDTQANNGQVGANSNCEPGHQGGNKGQGGGKGK